MSRLFLVDGGLKFILGATRSKVGYLHIRRGATPTPSPYHTSLWLDPRGTENDTQALVTKSETLRARITLGVGEMTLGVGFWASELPG